MQLTIGRSRQQAAGSRSRQQAAGSRQQAAGSSTPSAEAGSRHHAAGTGSNAGDWVVFHKGFSCIRIVTDVIGARQHGLHQEGRGSMGKCGPLQNDANGCTYDT